MTKNVRFSPTSPILQGVVETGRRNFTAPQVSYLEMLATNDQIMERSPDI
jgi:hypothetical protein